MELSKDVVRIAIGMDMWIFGGYVRDVVVRNQQRFTDIDICCSDDTTDVDQFLRVLSTRYLVTCRRDFKFKQMTDYGHMSRVILRLHKCLVYDSKAEKSVLLDIVVVSSFKEWCREKSADFTCNLFYMKKDVALGIRYIPDDMMYDPNPIDTLVEMTRLGDFRRIWDVPENRERQWENVLRIHERAKELVKRGWTIRGELMSSSMSLEILDREYAIQACDRAKAIIEMLHNRRAVSMLEECKGRDNVTRTVKHILSK